MSRNVPDCPVLSALCLKRLENPFNSKLIPFVAYLGESPANKAKDIARNSLSNQIARIRQRDRNINDLLITRKGTLEQSKLHTGKPVLIRRTL